MGDMNHSGMSSSMMNGIGSINNNMGTYPPLTNISVGQIPGNGAPAQISDQMSMSVGQIPNYDAPPSNTLTSSSITENNPPSGDKSGQVDHPMNGSASY